jgi:hypothetical protein
MVKYTILPSRRAYRVFPDPRYSAQRTHLGNGSGLPPNQAATKLADRPSTSSHSLFCQLESVAHVPQKHQEQRIVKGTNGSTLLTTSFLPHCGPFVVFLIRCAICPISRFAVKSKQLCGWVSHPPSQLLTGGEAPVRSALPSHSHPPATVNTYQCTRCSRFCQARRGKGGVV